MKEMLREIIEPLECQDREYLYTKISDFKQRNLYDYLREYERACLDVHIYVTQTGDILCERYNGIKLVQKRNQLLREILYKFDAGLK